MIPHRHLWQNHYGAAHRKNIDTSPLEGLSEAAPVDNRQPSQTRQVTDLR